ncbi:MAG TPA: hypothetical protein VGO58_02500, partial [Chitinophagaceae bacterium]|nr:hypothetical protein [Chitinophagaceae bacterium]
MKIVLYSVLCGILLFSCQKEAGTPDDLAPQGVAVFTLAGSPGACATATVVGYYASGTALSSANKVSVQVNVTRIGAYAVSTATVNGYKFSATGTFTTTGVQTLTLTATGTPVAAQTDAFTAGTGGCSFNVVVVTPAPAVYTLNGAPAACTGATIAGTYIAGTALTAANTATIKANVTSLGTYTLSTNTIGGMTFSKTGVFNTTGLQDVILVGTGTPTTGGANTLTPQIGTSSCT